MGCGCCSPAASRWRWCSCAWSRGRPPGSISARRSPAPSRSCPPARWPLPPRFCPRTGAGPDSPRPGASSGRSPCCCHSSSCRRGARCSVTWRGPRASSERCTTSPGSCSARPGIWFGIRAGWREVVAGRHRLPRHLRLRQVLRLVVGLDAALPLLPPVGRPRRGRPRGARADSRAAEEGVTCADTDPGWPPRSSSCRISPRGASPR